MRNIFTMEPDGSDIVQLTFFTDRLAAHPSWSPDGMHIVYADQLPNGSRQIDIVNADGSGRHRLFADEFFVDIAPSFSPDGSKVVFARCRADGTCAIAVARSDGTGHVRQLTPFIADAGESDPVYSPDGASIAFSGYFMRGVAFATYVMAADGTHIRRITPSGKQVLQPDWSPDGTSLLVGHCCDAPRAGLYSVHPDGSGFGALVSGAVRRSSFAPEGDRIAVHQGGATWVYDSDGSNGALIQNNAYDPAWGPVPGV